MRKNDLQSRTIDVLRFLLIFYVVLIHSYSSTRGMVEAGDFSGYRFVSFLFSLEIAQVAVPSLFFISGYLFFCRPQPYGMKLRKEARSLLVPYLLWNALILLLYFCLQSIPALSHFFSGNNLPVRDYGLTDFFRAFWDGGDWDKGNGTPILHQFWYIRNLIILGLASPLIRFYVKATGWWGAGALLLVWLFSPGQAFMAESFSCFVLGACFSLKGKDFLGLFRKYAKIVYILYPVLLVVNMALRDVQYMLPLDRIGFLFGMVFTANVVAYFVERYGKKRSYASLRGLGFFLFAFHDPLLTFVKRLALYLAEPPTDLKLIAVYFLAPAVVIVISLVVYRLLSRSAPVVTKMLTGRLPL